MIFRQFNLQGDPLGGERLMPTMLSARWTRLRPSPSGFVAGWLSDDPDGRQGLALFIARIQQGAETAVVDVDPFHAVGAFDLAVLSDSEAAVVYDKPVGSGFDQSLARITWPGKVQIFPIAVTTDVSEYDPAVVARGSELYLAHAWRQNGRAGIDVKRIDSYGNVALLGRSDSPANALKAFQLSWTADGALRAAWIDDSLSPSTGPSRVSEMEVSSAKLQLDARSRRETTIRVPR